MSYFSFFFLSLEKMWHPFNFIVLSVPHLKQSSWSFQQQAILAPNPMMEYYMHGTLSGRIWFDSQFSQDVFSLFYVSSNDFLELLGVLIPISPGPYGARDLNNSLANKFSQVPTPDTTILHTRTSILEHGNSLKNMISPLVIKRGIYTKFHMIDILLEGILLKNSELWAMKKQHQRTTLF